MTIQGSPDAAAAEARALREAFRRHPTLASLHADPAWPGLEARLSALLTPIRTWSPDHDREPSHNGTRLRVGHWNLEHGNRFDAIARALETHPALAGADLVTLNEVDLGMARSGNRDVARELAARLGLHAAWGALFLESTRGRDDDASTPHRRTTPSRCSASRSFRVGLWPTLDWCRSPGPSGCCSSASA